MRNIRTAAVSIRGPAGVRHHVQKPSATTSSGGGERHPETSMCPDFNGDRKVTVDELVTAVANALNGCGGCYLVVGEPSASLGRDAA
jgi:hypothetical protein